MKNSGGIRVGHGCLQWLQGMIMSDGQRAFVRTLNLTRGEAIEAAVLARSRGLLERHIKISNDAEGSTSAKPLEGLKPKVMHPQPGSGAQAMICNGACTGLGAGRFAHIRGCSLDSLLHQVHQIQAGAAFVL